MFYWALQKWRNAPILKIVIPAKATYRHLREGNISSSPRRQHIVISLKETYRHPRNLTFRHSREGGDPFCDRQKGQWIPAFAGMTKVGVFVGMTMWRLRGNDVRVVVVLRE